MYSILLKVKHPPTGSVVSWTALFVILTFGFVDASIDSLLHVCNSQIVAISNFYSAWFASIINIWHATPVSVTVVLAFREIGVLRRMTVEYVVLDDEDSIEDERYDGQS